jgi:hypothetical protein
VTRRIEPTRTRVEGTEVTMPATPEQRIAAVRRIVDRKTYAKIDGVMVDLFTASAIVKVYDALNVDNRQLFASLPVGKMGRIAFRLTK